MDNAAGGRGDQGWLELDLRAQTVKSKDGVKD